MVLVGCKRSVEMEKMGSRVGEEQDTSVLRLAFAVVPNILTTRPDPSSDTPGRIFVPHVLTNVVCMYPHRRAWRRSAILPTISQRDVQDTHRRAQPREQTTPVFGTKQKDMRRSSCKPRLHFNARDGTTEWKEPRIRVVPPHPSTMV